MKYCCIMLLLILTGCGVADPITVINPTRKRLYEAEAKGVTLTFVIAPLDSSFYIDVANFSDDRRTVLMPDHTLPANCDPGPWKVRIRDEHLKLVTGPGAADGWWHDPEPSGGEQDVPPVPWNLHSHQGAAGGRFPIEHLFRHWQTDDPVWFYRWCHGKSFKLVEYVWYVDPDTGQTQKLALELPWIDMETLEESAQQDPEPTSRSRP
jgi:hypothetical protein